MTIHGRLSTNRNRVFRGHVTSINDFDQSELSITHVPYYITIYYWFQAYWCIKRWNLLKNGEVSEIDLQYWPWPPSFQVWPPILKNVKGTYIYFWFWTFWCIERWNRVKNDQVSEIDLQYWPRPPSFQVWPPILKNVNRNPHLFFIPSILAY